MSQKLKSVIDHEKKHWDKVFLKEIETNTGERFSSYWWEDYYSEIVESINEFLEKHRLHSVLEAGSGSGKATILLSNKFEKTLLDISPNALKFAAKLSNIFDTRKPKTVEGNVLSMPFIKGSFDFVWNIGVIEHYSDEHIVSIISEMLRVCSNGGAVAVGIPNYYSGPILKAALLRWKLFNFLPGYRLDTERFFKVSKIENLIRKACRDENKSVESFKIMRFGSPLIMETPEKIMKLLNPIVTRVLPKNRFLILVVCKLK